MGEEYKKTDRSGRAGGTSSLTGYRTGDSRNAETEKKAVDINALNLPGDNKLYIVKDNATRLYKVGVCRTPRFTKQKIERELKRKVELVAVGLFINKHKPYTWFKLKRKNHTELDAQDSFSAAKSWMEECKKLDLLIALLQTDPYSLMDVPRGKAKDMFQ